MPIPRAQFPSTLTGFLCPLIFLCLLFPSLLPAQTCDFISYGVEDGLSQSEASCVMQDSRGYLWVGTKGGGVCSFDGITFHEYGKRDGLPGQIVTCIAEDSSFDMWFGTSSGLGRYDGKTFSVFDRSRGLGSDEIRCLLAKEDAMWIGNPNGIYEYVSKNDVIHNVLTTTELHAMAPAEDGSVWAGSAEGLFRIKNGKKEVIDLHLAPGRDQTVYSVCSDWHGLIYIGLSDGLLIYRPSTGTFTENALTKLLSGKSISNLFVDHSRSVWAATLNNMVVRCTPFGELNVYDRSNGLTADLVYMITEDDTRHIWMATREQSLLKFRSESFTYYGDVPGMGSTTVFRIAEDHAGKIWVGSTTDGLYCYDPSTQDSKKMLNGSQPFRQPMAATEDSLHRMWIGHADGLTCLQNDRPVKQLLNGIHVRTLQFDHSGNLWIGTGGNGVYVYDGKELKNYTAENKSLPGDFVHALHEDKKGNIWIGTNNGLSKFDGTKFTPYGMAEGLCNLYVGSITEDPAGNIWFHTDACVMRYDGKHFLSYTEDNGLASNTIYLIAFDKHGQLWVGTNKGLDRVKLDAEGNVVAVTNYSRNEGFRGIECNSRAVCLARDGALWFGTVKGVIRYDPANDIDDRTTPITNITGIRLFLEPTDWSWTGAKEEGWFHLPSKLELDYDHNHLTFLYQAIHLQNPQLTRYKFMLAGFDSTWQPVTSSTEITYTNLPAGTYVFRVMASSNEGKWNPAPVVSCPIIILPPPPPVWMRWWFIALCVLLIGGLLAYIVIGRARRIIRQRKELEDEVRERTMEISRQNQEKTLMLKEIHHRVKNNLQVISSLLNLQADGITDKRVLSLFEDCRHRVNSMALIHEKMYQSKNLVNIDIRNYIDDLVRSLIDAYDSNKTVHLHADIEDHLFRIDTIVPLGLILNEIISNSLKYAFDNRAEGDLYVSLRSTGPNKFVLKVADNGIGLPESIHFEKAESLGMQLIQMLSGQINGKVTVARGGGTKYRIEFAEEVKDRF